MGTIQSGINAALGGVAKLETMKVGINALQKDKQDKALAVKEDITNSALAEQGSMNEASVASREANKELKKINSEEPSMAEYPDYDEYRSVWGNWRKRQIEAQQKAESLKVARKEQKRTYDARMEVIKNRADIFNESAKKNKVGPIDIDALIKGGKK